MSNTLPPANQDDPQAALSQQLLRLSGQRIDCRLENGTLILRGRVVSYYQKQLVQTVAVRLPGVEQIVNELEVQAVARPGRTSDASGSAT